MRTGAPLGATVVAFMISTSALGDDTLFVHRLDASLHTVGMAGLRAGGEIVGRVHVSPAGEIVALVATDRGRLDLVRWVAGGREVSRHAVDLAPPIKASRLAGGALVVVTETAVARVALEDGRLTARATPVSPLGDTPVAATPHGAWFAFPERLVYQGLDGRQVTKPRPLLPVPGLENGFAGLFATERDECILAEERATHHAVKGRDGKPDRTFDVVLTLVGPGGDVLAQTAKGKLTTRWEWFWKEGSTAGPLPRGIGIVRTRYHGSVHFEAFSERADGGFVVVVREDVGRDELRHDVMTLDRGLREGWRTPYRGIGAWGRLPPGSKGILFRSGVAEIRSYAEADGAEQSASLRYPPGVDPADVMGTALGSDGAGHWMVVSYASPGRRAR